MLDGFLGCGGGGGPQQALFAHVHCTAAARFVHSSLPVRTGPPQHVPLNSKSARRQHASAVMIIHDNLDFHRLQRQSH